MKRIIKRHIVRLMLRRAATERIRDECPNNSFRHARLNLAAACLSLRIELWKSFLQKEEV